MLEMHQLQGETDRLGHRALTPALLMRRLDRTHAGREPVVVLDAYVVAGHESQPGSALPGARAVPFIDEANRCSGCERIR